MVKYYLLTRAVSIIFFLIGISFLPYLWCNREANNYFDDSYGHQLVLQRGVESWVNQDLNPDDYATGSIKFNREWLLDFVLQKRKLEKPLKNEDTSFN